MSDASELIASQCSLTLDLPPSCLEFCPAFPSYFFVGTYHLEQNTPPVPDVDSVEKKDSSENVSGENQKRNGSIVIFELMGDVITHVGTEPQPAAVLDLHFQDLPGKRNILGAVSSVGTLSICKFLGRDAGVSGRLVCLNTLRIPPVGEGVLFLSFAWHPSIEGVVAVTTSEGHVHILKLGPDYSSARSTPEPVISHDLEAWCVAIRPEIPTALGEPVLSTLLSGGDDSALRYATCAAADGEDAGTLRIDPSFAPVVVRGHDAGVTAILPLPLREQGDGGGVVVTGSYDDHIRVYSIAPLHKTGGIRRARLLGESDLGGGVWRLKLIRVEEDGVREATWRAWVLASCMHAGARIVQLRGPGDEAGCEVTVLGRFEEHKSMNYASDIQPGHSDGELVCVSTSFYDKLVCLWKLQLPRRIGG